MREALDWWGELWQIYSLLVSLSATICSHISSLAQTFVSRWGIPFTCFLFSLPLPCFYSKVSSQLLILSQYCCINTMLTCSATFLSFTIASLASDALNALWNSHSWHVYVQYSSGQDIAYHLWRGEMMALGAIGKMNCDLMGVLVMRNHTNVFFRCSTPLWTGVRLVPCDGNPFSSEELSVEPGLLISSTESGSASSEELVSCELILMSLRVSNKGDPSNVTETFFFFSPTWYCTSSVS